MDLFELEKEKKELESKIQSRKERIELQRSRLEAGAIDLSKVSVQGGKHGDTMTDAVALIVKMEKDIVLTNEWDKTFPLSDKVNHKKVTFHNRYGITLVADMYSPIVICII